MSPRKRPQHGATLIEVLVTILLLSFGGMSLAGLQAYAVASSKNAVNRGLAAAMASDLADMVRANPGGHNAGAYNLPATFSSSAIAVPHVTAESICVYPTCTPAEVAAVDVALLAARLKANLRAGAFAVVPAGTSGSQVDIYIFWHEQRGAGTAASESSFDSCPAMTVMDTLPRCYYVRVNL